MNALFAETLKRLRTEKGLTQRDLADQINITRSAVAQWESGRNLPDAVMFSRLYKVLGEEARMLLDAAALSDEAPNVIMVDDIKPIVEGGVSTLQEVMPNVTVTGFTKAADAVEYAKVNHVVLAFLDIDLGGASGLDLCRTLLEINPRTNVVFLTGYREYSFDAWKTGACGFMLKPLTPDSIREQLTKLRYPLWAKGADA